MSSRAFAGSLVAAAVLALAYAANTANVIAVPLLGSIEYSLLDLRMSLRGPLAASPEIAIVAYDDRTLHEAPELFARRAGHAALLNAMHAQGAKVIGLDLLYADRELLLAPELIDDIDAQLATAPPPSPEGALIERVAAEVHGDDAFIDALRSSGEVVLAMHVGERGTAIEQDRSLARGRFGQVVAGPHLPPQASSMVCSLPRFNSAVRRLGLISTSTDSSGSTRRVPLGARVGAEAYAGFAVQLLAAMDGTNRAKLVVDGSTGRYHVGDRDIAGDRGMIWLNWLGPAPFPTYSVVDVVNGSLPPDALRDRVVVVGYTHLAQDRVRTPFGSVPGVEVHATALDNLLLHRPLHRAATRTDVLWSLAWGLATALLFAARGTSPRRRLAGTGALIACAFAASELPLYLASYWLSAVGPMLTISAAAITGSVLSWVDEGRQRQTLRRLFAHYLSSDLVEELLTAPDAAGLHGERRELTVLFTDIRDFTTISERTPPLELARFLNAYFDPMTRAVLDNHGYVDKYIGDAVMAVFGAPVRRADHASDACATVIAMRRALVDVRNAAEMAGIDLAIGAGINTGDMVVGNMGSSERFDYTVLGDSVNLGSRLEGLTKHYGVFCIVGPATALAAKEHSFRPLDRVRVKGKAEPVVISELLGGPTGTIAAYNELDQWLRAMAAWSAGDLALARSCFEAFANANPGDHPSGIFLERLSNLTEAPPDWDGVYTHKQK